MKLQSLSRWAVFTAVVVVSFGLSASAQTTDESPAPSDQPSAPMEVGQPRPGIQSSNIDANGQVTEPQSGENSAAAQGDAQSDQSQPSQAQPGGPSGEEPAKTDMGVARISLIHGDVSTQRGDSGTWSAAALNQPVVTGDKVSTGDGARTEIQLDFANVLRLGPNSNANVANFTNKNIQIQVGQGIADYVVWKNSEVEPEIDTPNVAVHPAHHDGVFRIEVRPDGDTVVIVRKGQAQIATPQGSTEINAGDMATIRGSIDQAQYKISAAPDPDAWDQWNSDRDHLIENAQAWHHTNRYYTGSQDLDTYGQWQNVPDYGDVWVPNEPEGWAPYRNGNWTWEPYYGWTWVGYEPWGWAPYHYGRWFWWNNAWAWWPGPGIGWYRPFWSPAYVSFWGWGGGFGFGIGFGFGGWGGFGWLPIGPCDWFHPWWGGYRGRFGTFNAWDIGNRGRFGGFAPLHNGMRFSNIGNIHNEHIMRAMSTVGASRFGAGRVGAVAATRAQINGARQMAGNLPVVPSRGSLSASGRAAATSTIRNGGSRSFFGTHNNTARPASFQQETAHLQQTMAQNHVNGFTAGARATNTGSAASRGGFGGSSGKPSAGTAARGGELNNSGSRGFGGSTAAGSNAGSNAERSTTNANRGGERSFTPPSNNSRSFGSSNTERNANSGPNNGFRPFTPPSNSSAYRGGAGASPQRGGGDYWNRTAPTSPAMRGSGAGNYSQRGYGNYGGAYGRGAYGGGSSRPQLDMRQPIVRSPYSGGYSRGGYGGRGAAPSYNRGGYGGGGRMSAPRSSGGGGGGHSGGGGHAGGGGGGHSGGGGHGGGGHR